MIRIISKMMNWRPYLGKSFLFLVIGWFCITNQISSANSFIDKQTFQSTQALPELDSRFQEVLDSYLTQQKLTQAATVKQPIDWSGFIQPNHSTLDNLENIRRNLPSIIQATDQLAVFDLLEYLYDKNDTAAVRSITDKVKKQGHRRYLAKHYLLLAKYYQTRGNWKAVIGALKNVDAKSLAPVDQDYYHLLMGYTLQQQKEHRKAYLQYRLIAEQSPYYVYAKLNEATAYLKQGWWTEAHIELDKAIMQAKKNNDIQSLDRMYVTLGYSQLHYEFFRDARKTMRNVSLNGIYTNKALMGLGLSAAYQEDFPGAINAFSILSNKTPKDLNVDEVKLLLAKALEEVGNRPEALVAYQAAIDYYNQKILAMAREAAELDKINNENLLKKLHGLTLQSGDIYMQGNFIPGFFINNYGLLVEMSKKSVSGGIKASVSQLQQKYREQAIQMLRENIQVRESMIESYLSQAKLGMAKLYDRQ